MSLDSRLRQGLIGLASDVEPDPDVALDRVSVKGRRRRVVGIAAAVAMCVALGTVGVLAIPRLLDETDRGRIDPAAVDTFDAPGRFDLGVSLPDGPSGLVEVGGSLWVGQPDDSRVLRLDAASGELDGTVEGPGRPCGEPGAVLDPGFVWFRDCSSEGRVLTANVAPDAELAALRVPHVDGVAGPARPLASVWTWSNKDHTVNLVTLPDGATEKKFRMWNSTGIYDGVVWRRKVWVTDEERGYVSPVDVRTGAFPDIKVGRSATDVEVGAGAVWVADEVRGRLVKVSPRSTEVVGNVRVSAAATPIDLALAGGRVWVRTDDRLLSVDPRSLEVVERYRAPEGGGRLAAGEGGLWMTNPEDPSVWRLPVSDRVAKK